MIGPCKAVPAAVIGTGYRRVEHNWNQMTADLNAALTDWARESASRDAEPEVGS